jgi:Ca-activated chloride channel family protein
LDLIGLRLAEPLWLALAALAILPWWWERRRPRLAWPTLPAFEGLRRARWAWRRWLPCAARSAAIVALAIALARPQTVAGATRVRTRAVAIDVALDVSSSMGKQPASDDPSAGTRLDAARRTLSAFVRGRPDDLLGLVTFANYPDTACPPTLDHAFLLDVAEQVRPAPPQDDGTNIGDALAWAVRDVLDTSPRRKVVVLLTDGHNQPAVPKPLDPRRAATLAGALGVVVHAVAIGHPTQAPLPETPGVPAPAPGKEDGPDLALLGDVASAAGGRLFVATDERGLRDVFDAIDRLERSPTQGTIRTRYHEWFLPVALAALGLIGAEQAMRWRKSRMIP